MDPETPQENLVYGFIPDITEALSDEQVSLLTSCYQLIRSVFSFSTVLETSAIEPPYLDTFEDQRQYFVNSYGVGFSAKLYNDVAPITSKVGLYYVTNYGKITLLSCCVGVAKTFPDARNVLEVWAVASNPLFRRTGAAKFLLANIIFQGYIETWPHASINTIHLEVARDSFPYITFYDRLLMYYKLGFQVTSESICKMKTETALDPVEPINLQNLTISYPLGAVEPHGTYNGDTIPISKMKDHIPIVYPPEDNVYMILKPGILNYIMARNIVSLLKYSKPIPLSVDLPDRFYHTLYHSKYEIDPATHLIRSAQLPENIELVIMNTPGFNTYINLVSYNWWFSQKYLNTFSIEQLNLIFKGIQSTTPGILPSPLVGVHSVPYLQSIENNLLFRFNNIDTNPVLQFHSYKPGGFFPDLQMSSTPPSPASTDFMSLLYGVYDIPSNEYNQFEPRVRAPSYTDLTNLPTFETFSQLLPDPKHLIRGHFRDTDIALSALVKQISDSLVDGQTSRIYVYSCGYVEDAYVDYFKGAIDSYSGRLVDLNSDDSYLRALALIGATINISYGRNIVASGTDVPYIATIADLTAAGAAAATAAAAAVVPVNENISMQRADGGRRSKLKTRRNKHRRAQRSSRISLRH